MGWDTALNIRKKGRQSPCRESLCNIIPSYTLIKQHWFLWKQFPTTHPFGAWKIGNSIYLVMVYIDLIWKEAHIHAAGLFGFSLFCFCLFWGFLCLFVSSPGIYSWTNTKALFFNYTNTHPNIVFLSSCLPSSLFLLFSVLSCC